MKRKWISISLWIVAITAIVILIAFKLQSNKKEASVEMQKELQPMAYTVEAATVENKLFSKAQHYRGTVEASNIITIFSEADGKLVSSRIQKGAYVTKGQVLASVDRSIRSANLQINNAAIEKAKADMAKAVKDAQRYKELYSQNNASAMEVENAQLQEQAAITQYKTLTQQVNIAQKQVAQTNIIAPANGIIINKTGNTGDFVQPGTALGTIAAVSTVIIKVNVPEAMVVQLQTGKPVQVTADVFAGEVYKGIIKTIVPVATESRTFPVEIEVANNKSKKLMAGMSTSVVFNQFAEEQVLVIPRTALTGDFSQPFVYVIDSNKMPVKTAITLGRDFGEFLELNAGIKQGAIVVTSGQANIEPGKVLKEYKLVNLNN